MSSALMVSTFKNLGLVCILREKNWFQLSRSALNGSV